MRFKTKTTEEFINEAKLIFPNYDYSKVEYKHSKQKVTIICPIHGEFQITPNSLLRGSGCPKCKFEKESLQFLYTKELFIAKAKKVYGDKYDYSLVQFPRPVKLKKIKIICKKHGIFYTNIHNFLRGHGCPKCNCSKGEGLISYVLNKLKIDFESLYYLKVKNKRYYIDFYLPKENIFIEFNGIQHYKPIKAFGGIKIFFKQVIRDFNLKRYCRKNKITLITISYKLMENIEQILKNKINYE